MSKLLPPSWIVLAMLGLLVPTLARAKDAPAEAAKAADATESAKSADAPEIIVNGRAINQLGIALTASEGTVGRADFDTRPLQRVGELLEVVPGLIVTQHSGGGKANQYFLRGFNLDHGTDFAASLDGVPLNFRTHGHGQGYLDLNFIIPETIEFIEYSKGPYRAELGDFATAGAARFKTYDRVDNARLSLTVGDGKYYRLAAVGSVKIGQGDLLLSGEARYDDGPYQIKQRLNQFSSYAKYTVPVGDGVLRASFTGYYVDFYSPEQIPQRAITSGLITPFGALDFALGGQTTRIGGAINWSQNGDHPWSALAYAHYYNFKLISNFTYFLDDPVNGDEFRQADRRTVTGFRVDKKLQFAPFGLKTDVLLGTEGRFDFIPRVALYRTTNRIIRETVRSDSVNEGSVAVFGEATLHPTDRVRVTLGLRADYYNFDVKSSNPANSGRAHASIVSPKAGAAWRPTDWTELYVNYGEGFHSNDGRGTAITIDPVSGDKAEPVDPLVKARGSEVGVRIKPLKGISLTAAAWQLDLGSELLFLGDGGTTAPQGPSHRKGLEFAIFAQPIKGITFDGEYTLSDGRLTDLPKGEDRIPGAIEQVVAAGVVGQYRGVTASLRLRYFGSVALIEDNSVRSRPTTVVNGRLAYRLGRYELAAELLNVLNSRDSEINYYYLSRLPGEPADGVNDIHLKTIEPRELRVTGTLRF